jgi:hypothetical protein
METLPSAKGNDISNEDQNVNQIRSVSNKEPNEKIEDTRNVLHDEVGNFSAGIGREVGGALPLQRQPTATEVERLSERRAANRRSAQKSRKRKMHEIETLQARTSQLTLMNRIISRENNELRRQITELSNIASAPLQKQPLVVARNIGLQSNVDAQNRLYLLMQQSRGSGSSTTGFSPSLQSSLIMHRQAHLQLQEPAINRAPNFPLSFQSTATFAPSDTGFEPRLQNATDATGNRDSPKTHHAPDQPGTPQ